MSIKMSEFEKEHGLGFLRNCMVTPPVDGRALFYIADDGGVRCYLDGYAVVPKGTYDDLMVIASFTNDHGANEIASQAETIAKQQEQIELLTRQVNASVDIRQICGKLGVDGSLGFMRRKGC